MTMDLSLSAEPAPNMWAILTTSYNAKGEVTDHDWMAEGENPTALNLMAQSVIASLEDAGEYRVSWGPGPRATLYSTEASGEVVKVELVVLARVTDTMGNSDVAEG